MWKRCLVTSLITCHLDSNKEITMKTKGMFYYVRSKKGNAPVITVCLLNDGPNVARGLSVCSLKDVVNKKEGRKIALANARKALGTRKDGCKVQRVEALRSIAHHELDENMAFFGFKKAAYNPILNDYETIIVNKSAKHGR